jgi:membrane associated rhomboid family serine protease
MINMRRQRCILRLRNVNMSKQFRKLLRTLRFPFQFVLLLWLIHMFQFFLGIDLGRLGIYPRELFGLKGIVTGPLVHGDWQHLISNTIPLIALMSVLFVFFRRVAIKSFLLIYILTGLSVWLFAGPPVYHIGASGVVYGLVSFVFWSGVFRRSFQSIALALIILMMYSGYFYGILPGEPGISWESHLFGGIVGIFVAWFFKSNLERDEEAPPPLPEEGSDYFLNRDVFDRTRQEREKEREQDWWNTKP